MPIQCALTAHRDQLMSIYPTKVFVYPVLLNPQSRNHISSREKNTWHTLARKSPLLRPLQITYFNVCIIKEPIDSFNCVYTCSMIVDPNPSSQKPPSFVHSMSSALLLRRSLLYSFDYRSNSMPPALYRDCCGEFGWVVHVSIHRDCYYITRLANSSTSQIHVCIKILCGKWLTTTPIATTHAPILPP